MFKKVISNSLIGFFDIYGLDIAAWDAHFAEIDGRSSKTIKKYLEAYKNRTDLTPENSSKYANLIFAQLFLHYAQSKKGDFALDILTDIKLQNEDGSSKVSVPQYIKEGLQWLLK